MAAPKPESPVVVSLLPFATDCVLALGLDCLLRGRTHECTLPNLASVPVCTQPKIAPGSSGVGEEAGGKGGAEAGRGEWDSLDFSPGGEAAACSSGGEAAACSSRGEAAACSPADIHLAASTVRAAAWEIGFGLSPSSSPVPLVHWALSPYLTSTHMLSQIQPDVILTQLQPEEGVYTAQEIEAALTELVRKPITLVHLDPRSLTASLDDVLRIGRALGAEARAQEVVTGIHRRMHTVQSMCRGRPRRSLLCLQWLNPVFTAGAWVPELVRLAGGIPVGYQPGPGQDPAVALPGCSESSRGCSCGAPEALDERRGSSGRGEGAEEEEAAQELGREELSRAVACCDVVLLAVCGCTLGESIAQARTALHPASHSALCAAFQQAKRVRTGQGQEGAWRGLADGGAAEFPPIAVVDGSLLFSRPGPRLVDSLEVLAEVLHSEVQRFGHEGLSWQYL